MAKKRWLTCVLALVMLLSVLPVTAMAEAVEPIPAQQIEEETPAPAPEQPEQPEQPQEPQTGETENEETESRQIAEGEGEEQQPVLNAPAAWYNSAAAELTIGTVDDLLAFVAEANTNGSIFEGKKITLTTDLDLGGMNWTPIKSFKGEFNGNNKTIRNFKVVVDDTQKRGGFFNGIEDGDGERVHDLTIADVEATVGDGRFGVLANYIRGTVNRVTVKNIKVTTTHSKAWVGGMCAFMSWPWMNDCTVENLTVDAANGAEFIAGFSPILQKNSNMVFNNLKVNGFKVTVADTDGECGVGGFVGQTQRGWEQPKMTNCSVTGLDVTATGTVEVGGFICWPGAHTIAENCSTQGKINASGVTSTDNFVGGFFGNLGWNCDLGQQGHQITGCTADVDIVSGGAPAGGFVGSATNSKNASMYAEFTNCTATGDVTNANGCAGGFAGDADRGIYTGCKATGTVNGKIAGGFIGKVEDVNPGYDHRYPADTRDYDANQIKLDGCNAALTNVTGIEEAGGLVGSVAEKTSPDEAGSRGKLIVSGSVASSNVSGSGKVWPTLNAAPSKVDGAGSQNNRVGYKASYNANGGTGNMGTFEVVQGDKITLPRCAFQAPSGKEFDAWEINGQRYNAGDTYEVTTSGNVEIKALWKGVTKSDNSGTSSGAKNPGTKDDSRKPDGKTVKSSETFDGGIGLYVGMSLLSLNGSALVVTRKKRG